MKTVLALGTFDTLHPGHEFYLQEAKKLGDKLIVVVARDSTVLDVKKRKSLQTQEERVAALKKLSYVSDARVGHEKDKLQIVEEINPDVLAFGI